MFAAEFEPIPNRPSWLVLACTDGKLVRVDPPSEWLMMHFAAWAQPNTLKAKAHAVALWWRWCVDNGVDPLLASGVDFSRYLTALQSTPKNEPLDSVLRVLPGSDRARSRSAVRSYVDHVKQFYRWAGPNALAADKTVNQISSFKSPSVTRQMTASRLYEDQLAALFGQLLHPRDRFVIELLYGCGLRAGEALGLRVEDLHDSDDVARLFRCRYPAGIGPHLHVVKRFNRNGAAAKSPRERIVPLVPSVLRAYSNWNAFLYEQLPDNECGFIILSLKGPTRGGPWSVSAFCSMWTRRVKTIPGLEDSHPHILRHSYASELTDAGVAPFTIQELLGHAQPESTQIYTHVHARTQAAAVARLTEYRQQLMTGTSA